ncbi:N-acetyltransferase [bacterium]|nr:N-acetyltransferase [bacterium]
MCESAGYNIREEATVLRGTTIYLARLELAGAETARGWINDPEVNKWLLSGQIPVSSEAERAFFAASEEAWNAGTAYRFGIHGADDNAFVGICGLDQVSMQHRTAEVGICIGSVAHQNRGYGRDAIVTLLRFGFDTLGLHSISIKANADNARAVHLYTSIGFVDVGREREAVFMRGRFHDHICLDILEGEFRAKYGALE